MYYIRYYWILYVYCTSAGIFSLFVFIHRHYESAKRWAFDSNPLDEVYDYIVVGGGSAGSIVAGRLSENPNLKILLIEGGGESSVLHDIPLSAPMIQGSSYDWQYQTVPQVNSCLGMVDQVSKWPMGKILGGTSRLNYMIYLRGHKTDFDSWRNGNGFDWSLADILHYFKKWENHEGKYSWDTKHHGLHGPVFVSDMTFRTDLVKNLLEGGKELGYPEVDLNTLDSSPGMMATQVFGHNGARWSADHALRRRFNTHNNLKIITNTIVEKVLFRRGFEAEGVIYRQDSFIGKVYAREAVILSAGTVGSPKILLQSGIGPKQHLHQVNIEPLVDLPVGENLQDHVTSGLDLILLNYSLPISASAILKAPINTFDYVVNGNGVMTHPGCEVVGLFHCQGHPEPDLQIMALPVGLSTDAGAILKKAMNVSPKLWETYFAPLVGQTVITLLPTLLHPKSRGHIRLTSSNPQEPPIINPKYLDHPDDIKILIKGLQLIEKFSNTSSMLALGAKLNDKKIPGCEHLEFGCYAYWDCYLRHLTLTAYHPVGTCAMGSVVSHDLKVHGVNKLFVIDASVMPTLPSANINAAVMMIAEKGADIIKLAYNTKYQTCKKTDIFYEKPMTYIDIPDYDYNFILQLLKE